MTAQPLWLYVALDIVLGPKVDRPIDQWARDVPARRAVRAGWHAVEPRSVVARRSRCCSRRTAPPALEAPPRVRDALPRSPGLGVGICCSSALGWRPDGGRAGRASRLRHRRRAVGPRRRVHRLFSRLRVGVHRPRRRAPQPEHPAVRAVGASLLFGARRRRRAGPPGRDAQGVRASPRRRWAPRSLAAALKVGFVAHQENGALIAFFVPAWLGHHRGAAAASLRYSIRNVQTLRWLVSGTPNSSG